MPRCPRCGHEWEPEDEEKRLRRAVQALPSHGIPERRCIPELKLRRELRSINLK